MEGLSALRKVTIAFKHLWSTVDASLLDDIAEPFADASWPSGDRLPCNGSGGLEGGLGPVSGLGGLQVIDLSYNALEGDISAVENLTLLTELALDGNKIGGDISSVHNLSRLKSLRVGAMRQSISDEDGGLHSPAGDGEKIGGDVSEVSHLTALTHLDVSSSAISGEIGSLRNLTDLVFLDMAESRVAPSSVDGLAALGRMVGLRYLNMMNTGLQDDITPLTDLTSLTSLALSAADMSVIRRLTSLKRLYLHKLDELSGDANDLADLTQLTLLALDCLRVQCGLRPDALSGLVDLVTLILKNTELYISGRATPICAGMQKLRTLYLDLFRSTSGTLSDILGSHPDLEYISVRGESLSGDLSPLRDSPALVNLMFAGSNISGDLTPLEGLPDLVRANFWAFDEMSITGSLEPLRGLTNLEILIFLPKGSLNGSLEPLRGLTALKALVLTSSGLSGDLSPLRNLTSMELLVLLNNGDLTGNLAPLRGMKSLFYLDVDGCNLSVDLDDLTAGFSSMENLTYLYLSGNDLSGDVAALAPLTSLVVLGLDHWGAGRGGLVGNLSFVQGMLNMKILLMNNQQLSGGLGPLQNLTQMVAFAASYNDLSGDLSSVPESLWMLWLEGNNISGLGGFNSSGMMVLNLGSNKVMANGVDIVKGLPATMQILNVSDNDLRGDIGEFITNVSATTDIMDLYVTQTELTGTAEPRSILFFRNFAWQTGEMGTLEKDSGSANITLDSRKLKLSNVTYDTVTSKKRLPPFEGESRYRVSEYGSSSLVDMSGYCERATSEQATSEAGASGSAANRLVFHTAERDDKYLIFCPVQADEDLLEGHGLREVARASGGIEVDSIYSRLYKEASSSFFYLPKSFEKGQYVTTKSFISYEMDVQNNCGSSVCAFHDQSVSWPSMQPQQLQPFKSMNNNATLGGLAEQQYNDSSDGLRERNNRAWRIKGGEEPPGLLPEELVNSLCIVDLEQVWKCPERLQAWGQRRAAPITIVVKGTFMSPALDLSDEKSCQSDRCRVWANTTDFLTYKTKAVILRDPTGGLNELEPGPSPWPPWPPCPLSPRHS